MKTVLEIGCGETAGPFFEGASEHFIVDMDEAALTHAAEIDPSLTPMVGDARNLDCDDNSIDIILARNVFGDPSLGESETQKRMAYNLQNSYLREGNAEEFKELNKGLMIAANNYKQQIVREAARVLVRGGQLVVIEQYTPIIAEVFLEGSKKLNVPSADLGSLVLEKSDLELATPPNYAFYHGRRSAVTETWIATKVS